MLITLREPLTSSADALVAIIIQHVGWRGDAAHETPMKLFDRVRGVLENPV